VIAYGINSGSVGLRATSAAAGEEWRVTFDFVANLTRGHYLIELHAADPSTMTFFAMMLPAAMFRVHEHVTIGIADLAASCSISPNVCVPT
jgi:hypothetical protein